VSATDDVRAASVAVLRRYLDAWSVLDLDAVAATLADDVDWQLGYTPPGVPAAIAGRDAVMAFLAAAPTVVTPLRFHVTEISTLADPAELVAQYRGDARAIPTDRVYRNEYITRARVEDGRIVRIREFSNPLVFLDAYAPADPA
jgi:uncharacterized protein